MDRLSLGTFFWLLFLVSSAASTDTRCEKMRIPWCMGAYDDVIFPNFFGHKTQEEAYYAMHKVWPLIQTRCSAEIGTYLCRLYAPQCPFLVRGRDAEYVSYYQPEQAKPPCEQACLRIKKDCQKILSERGLEWPPELDCHRLRHKDCYERPTVEVRPTEMASTGQVDWEVETVPAYKPAASRNWQTSTPGTLRTTTTMISTTASKKSPPTTSKQRQVVHQSHSTTNRPTTTSQSTTAPTKPTTTEARKAPTKPTMTPKIAPKATVATVSSTVPSTTGRIITVPSTAVRTASSKPTVSTAAATARTTKVTVTTVAITTPTAVRPVTSTATAFTTARSSTNQTFDPETPSKSRVENGKDKKVMIIPQGQHAEVTPPVSTTSVPSSELTTIIQDLAEESSEQVDATDSDQTTDEPPKVSSRFGVPGEESSDEIRFYPSYEPSAATCQPLTVPACRNLGYNMTNIDGESQNLAAIQIFYFSPLVQEVKCSDYLQAFLCAAYAPPCKAGLKTENVLPPCRSFCQSARNDCEELIEKLGFRWPEELECELYPLDSDKCVAELTQVEEVEEADSVMPPPARPVPRVHQPSVYVPGGLEGTKPPRSVFEDPIQGAGPSVSVPVTQISKEVTEPECEPILATACQNMPGYNSTKLPNIFGHNDQLEAGITLNEYLPLIDVKCSPHIALFVCTVHLPPCQQASKSVILPCRSLCESVRNDCKPLLNRFGFEWPAQLNCSRFPPDQGSSSCVRVPKETDRVPPRVPTTVAPSAAPPIDTEARIRALKALRGTAPLNPACEKVSASSVCRDLYDMTAFPNILNHASQSEADFEMIQFKPVIDSGCSPYLTSFLCSIYTPVCTVLDHPLPPCRQTCLDARRGCESIMNTFGFRWPPHLNCSQYPALENGELCWSGEFVATGTTSTVLPTTRAVSGPITTTPVSSTVATTAEVITAETSTMEVKTAETSPQKERVIDLERNLSAIPRADASLGASSAAQRLGLARVTYLVPLSSLALLVCLWWT